jgi:hypothetical protein
MSSGDDNKRTLAGGRDAPPRFVVTKQNVLYMLRHSLLAMAFIFILQFFILKAPLQTALMWTLMFGAMAFTLAFSQVKRQR